MSQIECNKENFGDTSSSSAVAAVVAAEDEDWTDVSADMCAICLDEVSMAAHLTDCCDHRFCFECLLKWSKVQNMCPLCCRQYGRFDSRICRESQLNHFEKILIGRIRRDTLPKHFALRKLLKSPKCRELDRFWQRVFTAGIVCKRKIVILLLVDANQEPNGDLLAQRVRQLIDTVSGCVEDDSFAKVIDSLLKSRANNVFLMTLIVCYRRVSKVKK